MALEIRGGAISEKKLIHLLSPRFLFQPLQGADGSECREPHEHK
jgi:hypothetical protein